MKLEIKDVCIEIGGKKVVDGTDLNVNSGELHVLMGPNGCGKSSLAKGVMGHPDYKIKSGKVLVDGKEINFRPDDRIEKGLKYYKRREHMDLNKTENNNDDI